MAENSKIEWTDHTFNPWMGCSAVSPACDHCYAEAQTARFKQVGWGAHAPRKCTSAANWNGPVKWNKQAEEQGKRFKVFCASLADVFDNHESIPSAWRRELWGLIRDTPNLDWLLLTKRPQNFKRFLPDDWGDGYANVWLGTTVENQTEAERRIPILLNTPARLRFLSCEPLLGPVRLHKTSDDRQTSWNWLSGDFMTMCPDDISIDRKPKINWVICGGESGPHARPMHPDWARALRDQCGAAGVPFFFKQWGEWAPGNAFGMTEGGPVMDKRGHVGNWMRRYVVCGDARADILIAHSFTEHSTNLVYRTGKKRAGHQLDGVEHHAIPKFEGVV